MSDVEIWHVDLDVAPDATALLLDEERERASRFVFAHDGRRWAAARAALRSILGRLLDRPPLDVALAYGPHGKPSLADPAAELRFNLSHSGRYAVVAVTRGREVGVDVERLRRISDAEAIVARHFAPAEIAAYRALPDGARLEAFFRLWVRKEAVLKATGAGLSAELEETERLAQAYTVVELPSPEGTVAALATEPPLGRLVVRAWGACDYPASAVEARQAAGVCGSR